jgi:outer membrane lipoprotein SlyB
MLVIGAVAALALGGCASGNSGYASSPPTSCGSSNAGLIGALAGAGGGALLGNQFGKGSGKYATTGAGALAGGAGGYALGNSLGNGC